LKPERAALRKEAAVRAELSSGVTKSEAAVCLGCGEAFKRDVTVKCHNLSASQHKIFRLN